MPNQRKNLGRSLENRVVERAVAKGLKARRQPLSGILKDFPRDVELENLLVECKVRAAYTTQNGHRMLTLDIDWLRGVQADGKEAGYEQGIVVVNPKGDSSPFVLVDLDWFLSLLTKRAELSTIVE